MEFTECEIKLKVRSPLVMVGKKQVFLVSRLMRRVASIKIIWNMGSWRSDISVRIPESAIISDDKISRYLLVQKARNNKSKFLAQAKFILESLGALKIAI